MGQPTFDFERGVFALERGEHAVEAAAALTDGPFKNRDEFRRERPAAAVGHQPVRNERALASARDEQIGRQHAGNLTQGSAEGTNYFTAAGGGCRCGVRYRKNGASTPSFGSSENG